MKLKRLFMLVVVVVAVAMTESAWYGPVVQWQHAAALFLPRPSDWRPSQ